MWQYYQAHTKAKVSLPQKFGACSICNNGRIIYAVAERRRYLLPTTTSPFVAIISITKLMPYFHKHYIEREWDIMYDLLTDRTKQQLKKQCDVLNLIIGLCYFCGIPQYFILINHTSSTVYTK